MSSPSSVPCKLLLPSLAAAIKMCHTFKCSWLEIDLNSQTPHSFCLTACVLKLYFYMNIIIYNNNNVIFLKTAQSFVVLRICNEHIVMPTELWILNLVGLLKRTKLVGSVYSICDCLMVAENRSTVWFSQSLEKCHVKNIIEKQLGANCCVRVWGFQSEQGSTKSKIFRFLLIWVLKMCTD